MKMIYFENLKYGNYADLVTCPHCQHGEAMLVPVGMQECPLCGDDTIWKDEANGNYEIELGKAFSENEIVYMESNVDWDD